LSGLVASLAAIQVTPARGQLNKIRIPQRDLTFLLRNLSTLISNGLPLIKSLETLARESSLRRMAPLLNAIRGKMESGEMLSSAMADYPRAFNEVLTNQVRAGERSGMLSETLTNVANQLERSNELRSQVVRKLSYPAILVVAGSMSVTFMLLFVVPVFQETYDQANIPLPLVTQALIMVGEIASTYVWIPLIVIPAGVWGLKRARRNPVIALELDRLFLKIPVFGELTRYLVILRFMDVLGDLLDAGFTVVEALRVAARVINNRAIRQSVDGLFSAVTRGERFSRELDRLGDMFPPIVSQLVVIGEKTGSLPKATKHIRDHLRRDIEHRTNVLVATIEPVLTISLAAAIGVVLLAIYLPMFDMIGASGAG